MRRVIGGLLVSLLAMADPAAGASAAGPAKLPPAEARQWISALRAQKTDDGSTVAEVLAYAGRMRPAEFKAGGLDVVSMGDPAKPVGVGVDVFIGAKRRADDAMTLSYEAKLDGRRAIAFTPMHPQADWPEAALLRGRDAFLVAIEKEYQDDCVDVGSGTKTC